MLPLLLALLQQDPGFARAESLLAAKNYPAALHVAERLASRYPKDPAAHMLLGRIHYARPVVGRYPALEHFRMAARLAPEDTAPLQWQARVGEYLKSDEGERMIREALLKVLALTPDDPALWTQFQDLYHNDHIWAEADHALARHPGDPIALGYRAEIALAQGDAGRADSLAAQVLAIRPRDLGAFLTRAEAGFLAQHDAVGYAWYDSTLVYADLDSTDQLWRQVWMIASPSEFDHYRETDQGGRREFFEWFWGHRDPNLVTPENERIAEHFRRLAYVRQQYHLLHPYVLFNWSPVRREVVASHERDWAESLADSSPGLYPGDSNNPSLDALRVKLRAGPDIRDVNGAMGVRTLASVANLDARGLLWIRHGKPDVLMNGVPDPLRPTEPIPGLDLEGWAYYTDDGPVSIALHQSMSGGDFILSPISVRQEAGARLLMQTDRTTLPATLKADGWSAFFASDSWRLTDLYVKTAPESAAMVLWDSGAENEVARAVGAGLLRVSAPPGPYHLGLDVDSGGAVGRIRQPVRLPAFSDAALGLSSLVIATRDSLLGREQTLAAMPVSLTFPAGRPLATYAEVYGLTPDAQGQARYLVRYTFDGPGAPVRFEFTRELPARAFAREQLVVAPTRLPAGHYTVSLAVTDLHTNVKVVTRDLKITLQ